MADLICNVTLSPPLTVNISINNAGSAVPSATAENDFIVAGPTPFAWLKKTLAQVKVILGLGSAAYTASGDYATSGHNHSGTYQSVGSYLVASDITDKVDKITGSSLLADTKLALLDHEILGIACSDTSTDLTTGEKIAFDMPFSCVLTRVYGSLTTPATGNALTVDIEDEGTSILNAVLSIANGANNGETSVFAAAAANYAFTKGDLISIDIDQVGSTAAGKGLIIFLEGYRT